MEGRGTEGNPPGLSLDPFQGRILCQDCLVSASILPTAESWGAETRLAGRCHLAVQSVANPFEKKLLSVVKHHLPLNQQRTLELKVAKVACWLPDL